jgi:hypothetical protein
MEEFELHSARTARLAACISRHFGLRSAEIRSLERAECTHVVSHQFLVSVPATKRGLICWRDNQGVRRQFATGAALLADVPDSKWIDPLVPAPWIEQTPASVPSHYSFG